MGRVFYCPWLATSALRSFSYVDGAIPAANNPWIDWPGYTTRITYSLRMEYAAWDGGGAKVQYPNQRWDMDRSTASVVYVHFARPYAVFPRAGEFNRKGASAPVSDLTDIKPIDPRLAHRGAINVLYANWAAKSVPREYVETYLRNVEVQNAANPSGGAPGLRALFRPVAGTGSLLNQARPRQEGAGTLGAPGAITRPGTGPSTPRPPTPAVPPRPHRRRGRVPRRPAE